MPSGQDGGICAEGVPNFKGIIICTLCSRVLNDLLRIEADVRCPYWRNQAVCPRFRSEPATAPEDREAEDAQRY